VAKKSRSWRPESTPSASSVPASPRAGRAAGKRYPYFHAALWGLILLAYSNSFQAGLIYDNHDVIVEDARLRQVSAANTSLILTQDYWYGHSVSGLFRPLTTFSYQFNYAVLGNGTNPAGYHFLNFLLHAVNASLVFGLGLLLWEEAAPAFAMAALWALHPVLTESVTNVVGRADLLSTLSILGALFLYLRAQNAEGTRRLVWLGAMAAAIAAGMFSKESAIVVLAVVPLYEIAAGRGGARPVNWRAPAVYAALALPVALYFVVRGQALTKLGAVVFKVTDNSLEGAGFLTSRLTALKIIGKYLWLLLWPAHLSADYSFHQIPLFSGRLDNPEDWKTVFSLVVIAALALAAVWAYRRAWQLFFLIGFFFITLSPTANLAILIGSVMAERFLYLPSVAFAGCLVWAGWAVYRRVLSRGPAAHKAAAVLLAAGCLAYAGRTWTRNADWYDGMTLWTSAVQVVPASFRAHYNLAQQYLEQPGGAGLERAVPELERAIAIMQPLPDEDRVPAVYSNAALCYRRLGDRAAGAEDPQANPWYRKSLETYLLAQRIDRANIQAARRANGGAGRPSSYAGGPQIYLGLGRLYMRLHQPDKALPVLDAGHRIKPQLEFFEEMSAAYHATGDDEQAALSLMAGFLGNPNDPRAAAEMAQFYRQTAPQSCALNPSGLNLACPLVRGHLCAAARNLVVLYRQIEWNAQAEALKQIVTGAAGCPVE
jgi:protein O-mannosyl-transferase